MHKTFSGYLQQLNRYIRLITALSIFFRGVGMDNLVSKQKNKGLS